MGDSNKCTGTCHFTTSRCGLWLFGVFTSGRGIPDIVAKRILARRMDHGGAVYSDRWESLGVGGQYLEWVALWAVEKWNYTTTNYFRPREDACGT